MYWDFYWVRYMFFNSVGNFLLHINWVRLWHVDRVRFLYGNFDCVRDFLLYGVGYMLVNRVVYGIWAVHMVFYCVRNMLLHSVRNFLLHIHRVGFRHMYCVGLVDVHFHCVWYLEHNWTQSYMHITYTFFN